MDVANAPAAWLRSAISEDAGYLCATTYLAGYVGDSAFSFLMGAAAAGVSRILVELGVPSHAE